MIDFTIWAPMLAIPGCLELAPLLSLLVPLICQLVRLILDFKRRYPDITPQDTLQFEQALASLVREIARVIVEWTYNSLENASNSPKNIWYFGRRYRRRMFSRNNHVSTLFGAIILTRYLYQPVFTRASIFPLEMRLGLFANLATPALAERIGYLSSQCTQSQVLDSLSSQFGVSMSVSSLRKIVQEVSERVGSVSHQARVKRLLDLLDQANRSKGNRKIVLAVGRDGIFVKLRGQTGESEASVATVAIFDRQGKRLGTVYLGQMPESGQGALTSQLTALLQDVLKDWQGPMPRLAYITDAGSHQNQYYHEVLKEMLHPRTGEKLVWTRVVDYWHVCQYITKISEALFGATPKAKAWASRMRHVLKEEDGGIHRLLRSAGALKNRYGVLDPVEYRKACAYLRRRMQWMNYKELKSLNISIGSGVTEAGCKVVVSERLKLSGMRWSFEGGQTIMDLRTIKLSGIWAETFQLALMDPKCLKLESRDHFSGEQPKNAA